MNRSSSIYTSVTNILINEHERLLAELEFLKQLHQNLTEKAGRGLLNRGEQILPLNAVK